MPKSKKTKPRQDLEPYIRMVKKALKEQGLSLSDIAVSSITQAAKILKAKDEAGELE